MSDHRASANALAHLRTQNAEADRRRERRALTDHELRRLIEVAENAGDVVEIPHRRRPKGKLRVGSKRVRVPDRALLYRVAVGTGLRASELRSLTPASFDLDADPPTGATRCEGVRR